MPNLYDRADIYDLIENEERYHPIPRRLLLDGLAELGYRDVKQFCFPAFANRDPEQAEWYCVLAKKGA